MADTPSPKLMSSKRIRLRRLKQDDAELFCRLNNDEGVMTYLDHQPPSKEVVNLEVEHIIDSYNRWPQFGRWIAEGVEGEFLGWFSLAGSEQEMPTTLELGYRLRRQFWGWALRLRVLAWSLGSHFRTQWWSALLQPRCLLMNGRGA